jgi:hypothetical protein
LPPGIGGKVDLPPEGKSDGGPALGPSLDGIIVDGERALRARAMPRDQRGAAFSSGRWAYLSTAAP